MEFTLLPCPFKVLTGCDCPACGLQRSILHLLQGEWGRSFELHPAPLELLGMMVIWILFRGLNSPRAPMVLRWGSLLLAASTLLFYALKLTIGACCE